MSALLDDVRRLLARDLAGFSREIEQFDDDESVWRTVPGVTNSAGTLALHVCGGLQHFIGGALGSTGYIRDREAEFASRGGSRASLRALIEQTSAVVDRTLASLSDEILAQPMPVPVGPYQLRTGLFLMHLAVHLGFHLGQAGYVRRMVTGKGTSTDPIPLAPLVDSLR